MEQRVFASGAGRITASAFLAVLWLIIGVGLFFSGILFIDGDTGTYLILFSIISVVLMIMYIYRMIMQCLLKIVVDRDGITVKKGNGAGRTYPFAQYQITADSSNDSTMFFLFGLMSLFAGVKNQLMITDQNGRNKTVVTHLSKTSFKELVDLIERENARVDEELRQKEAEDDLAEEMPASKEYTLNKRTLKTQFIMVVSIFMIVPIIITVGFFLNQFEYGLLVVVLDCFMLLMALLASLPLWFTARKIPSKVILRPDCFYLNDKQFFIREISKMQLNSTVKRSKAGYRIFNFVYEGKKHKYFLGMNADTKVNKSILILNEYKEIVSYFKKQFKDRPNVLQTEI